MEGVNDLETGFSIFKDFIRKQVTSRDTEMRALKSELLRKDHEIKDLVLKLKHQEIQTSNADKRIIELNRTVAKLSAFKNTILQSLALDDSPESEVVDGNQTLLGNDSMLKNDTSSQKEADHTIPVIVEKNELPPKQPSFQLKSSSYVESPTTQSQFLQSKLQTMPSWTESQTSSSPSRAVIQGLSELDMNPPPVNFDNGKPVETVDGRSFFRKARTILSYDEFTTLLWQVKCYNNKEQSKRATIAQVEALFGDKNRQLLLEFEQLMGVRT